ncbi:MAG: YgiT-type zinc finger protein [Acidobacteriota bacterium]
MKCSICGGQMRPVHTDLPFKLAEKTIVILKQLPVTECTICAAYLIEDTVFARVEELLSAVDPSVELEIIPFAA